MNTVRFRPNNPDVEEAVLPGVGNAKWLARLIGKRLDDPSQLYFYMDRDGEGLVEPESLRGMAEAADILTDYIRQDRKVAFFADMDADGIGAMALVATSLHAFGFSSFLPILPSRDEGHGLNDRGIQEAKAFGADLIVTLDNGSSSRQHIEKANAENIRILVTDHHSVPDPDLPAAVIVNPKHPKDTSGDPDFCGAGIAYLLMCAVRERLGYRDRVDLGKALQIASVSTLADMVPLTRNNMIMVRAGIRSMRDDPLPVIEEVAKLQKLDISAITGTDIAWRIAPCLNALGRIEKPDIAYEALMTDRNRAKRAAEYMVNCNVRRKEMLADMMDKAPARTVKGEFVDVFVDPTWHLGLVGLGAGRYARENMKVTGCGTIDEDDNWRISFRSPGKGAALDRALAVAVDAGLVLGAGGHDSAGGATVPAAKLKAFVDLVSEQVGKIDLSVVVDGPCPPTFWDVEKIEFMKHELEPCGMSNPGASFFHSGPVKIDRILQEKHISFVFDGVKGICFNCIDQLSLFESGQIAMTYSPSVNAFRGNVSIQVIADKVFAIGDVEIVP